MSENLQVPYRSIPDMFLQRVAATPDANAFAYPTPTGGPAWLTWKQVGDRANAIAAGLHEPGRRPEDRVGDRSPTPGSSGSWPTSASCAPARRPPRSTRPPSPRTRRSSWPTPGSRVLIAEDAAQAAKVAGADLPDLTHVVLIDGTADAAASRRCSRWPSWRPRAREALAADPDLVDAGRRRASARPPRHPDLHLRHDRHAQGRRAAARRLVLGGRGPGRARPAARRRPAVPVAAAVALVRQDADLRHHPRRPADLCGRPGRQDRREPGHRQADADVRARPASSRRSTTGSSPRPARPAAPRRRSSSWAVKVGKQRSPLRAGRQAADRRAEGQARHRRQAGLQQAPASGSAAGSAILVSGSAPLSKDIAEFFAAAGLTDPGGVRPDRDLAPATSSTGRSKLKFGTVGRPMGDLEVPHRRGRRGRCCAARR